MFTTSRARAHCHSSSVSAGILNHAPSCRVRQVLSSFLAVSVAASGFTSTSCASPALPSGGSPLRIAAGGYEMQVLVDGAPAPTFESRGENYVLGKLGARYTLRITNHTGRRIEAVASVDGRDAMDGKTADVRTKRGYLVPAWGTLDIDGWRLSQAEVAAFRFSSVADSYAGRTGSARDVGVIGVAVFPERYVAPPRPVYAPPRTSMQEYERRGLGSAEPPSADKGASRSYGDIQFEMPADRAPRASGHAPAAAAPKSESRMPARRSLDDSLAQAEGAPAPRNRPGLGTEFGEAVNSPVREVSFVRANATRPSVILGARYNDRQGLLALGINVDGCCDAADDLAWRQSATPFPASDRRYAKPPAGWHQGCCMRY